MVSTVETASRISGVETGVRWWLQRRNSNNPDRSKKRRRLEEIDSEQLDIERGLRDSKAQTNIQESFSELTFSEPLPAYDNHRSPNYEEKQPMDDQSEISRSRIREWQQRIMVYTSGLGVSLSEESLRSLRHCLEWLRWATQRIHNSIRALHEVLDKNFPPEQSESFKGPQEEKQQTQASSSDPAGISQYVNALDQSIRSILKEAIRVVDQFAGNALPENARQLVRRYITTFPLSFRIVNTLFHRDPGFGFPGYRTSQGSETDARTRKAILFAREGLNMLVQIAGVLDGTIASAVQWVDRLEGRGCGEENGNIDGDVANSTPENQIVNEPTVEEAGIEIVMDGTTVMESAGNESDGDGGLTIRTSGLLGALTGKDGVPLRQALDGPPENGTPRNGAPRNGTSANGTPVNGTPTNGTPRNGTPTNEPPRTGIRDPSFLRAILGSAWGRERFLLPQIRNPNSGPSPPSSPISDDLANGTSENERLVNGDSTNGGLTNGHTVAQDDLRRDSISPSHRRAMDQYTPRHVINRIGVPSSPYASASNGAEPTPRPALRFVRPVALRPPGSVNSDDQGITRDRFRHVIPQELEEASSEEARTEEPRTEEPRTEAEDSVPPNTETSGSENLDTSDSDMQDAE